MHTNPSPDCCHCSPDFTSFVMEPTNNEVFNECLEAENWLRDVQQVQDGLPKHAEPVLLSADRRKREEAIDRVGYDKQGFTGGGTIEIIGPTASNMEDIMMSLPCVPDLSSQENLSILGSMRVSIDEEELTTEEDGCMTFERSHLPKNTTGRFWRPIITFTQLFDLTREVPPISRLRRVKQVKEPMELGIAPTN
ncbi:hypothetical protein Tco_1257733 [Tanacetum coccineum]